MITSDAIAMPLSNTHFFRERIYASSVFFDHHGYLIQMTIVIPYKTYKIKDLETYFIRLSFSTSYLFPPLFPLEAGTHPKIVKKKKNRPFFKSTLWGGCLLEHGRLLESLRYIHLQCEKFTHILQT